MQEQQQEDKPAERPESDNGAASSNPRDGLIDFSGYSSAQLEELQYGIDRRASPRDFANLMSELERRRREAAGSLTPQGAVPVRFTTRDGLWGWLQATRRRCPVYSTGEIVSDSQHLILRGRQLTWLGVPHEAEVSFPLAGIRNVARDGTHVHFEYRRRTSLWRRIECNAATPQAAESLVGLLPASRSPGFERRWSQLRDFNRHLAAVDQGTWVTYGIVLANIGVFTAMAIAGRRLGLFDPAQLLRWGANYGPLTVNGQWWRLITAVFMHGSLLHLLVNMWALWNVGRMTERLYGRWCYAALYFVSGTLSSLASIAWDPTHSTVGASGAIFGIFGAFLASLKHPGRYVPPTIVRAHWLSTTVFVGFNLVSGALQTGVDNAAHVGGLLSGLALGWLLMRPLDAASRTSFPVRQGAAALALTALAVLAALWQVRGIGARLAPPEQYVRAHNWYLAGEHDNLGRWQELAGRAASGTISDAELAQRFQQEILPFWKSSYEHLLKEQPTVPAAQRPFAALATDFVRLRLAWAQAVIDAADSPSAEKTQAAVDLAQQTDAAQARLDRALIRATMDHRPRALANSAWVMAVRRLWPGPAWKCTHEPPAWGVQPEPGDSRTDGPAMRAAAGCRAQQLFIDGDYRTLDAWLEKSSAKLEDLPDGSSTLEGIAGGLSELFDFGGLQPAEVWGHLADWRHAVAGSVYAELMEVKYLEAWAWAARGSGYASSVSQQGWAIYAHRLTMARSGLEEIGARSTGRELWYTLSLRIGLAQSKSIDELRGLFDAGVKVAPGYLPLYRAMLRALMPRWGGSYEQVDQFITQLTTHQNDDRDFEMYARLYWLFAGLERDDANIFADGRAKWPDMWRGFRQMMQAYPHSDLVPNAFARFACLAEDPTTYRWLRPLIEQRRSAVAWTAKTSIESCDKAMLGRP
jgi:membrane associated rhomboid family serine protease